MGAIIALFLMMLPLGLLQDGSMLQRSVDLTLFPALLIFFAFCMFCMIPLSAWWLWQYCGTIAKFTNRRLSQQSAFGLFFLLSVFGAVWVWPGVVQGYINSKSLSSAS
jgi:hypothetical protein